jgi:hypothetical protein
MTRAPWAITTVVSCLPVLVLGMGTALAHMLRADAAAVDGPETWTGPPSVLRSLSRAFGDQDRPDRGRREKDRDWFPGRDQNPEAPGPQSCGGGTGPVLPTTRPQVDQARVVARRLAAAGKPVSRRALRCGGVRGSNVILSPGVSWDCDLRRRVEDSVADGMRAA